MRNKLAINENVHRNEHKNACTNEKYDKSSTVSVSSYQNAWNSFVFFFFDLKIREINSRLLTFDKTEITGAQSVCEFYQSRVVDDSAIHSNRIQF